MALETGTYISDLVTTNPTASDPKSQGDDHLRLIKSTVKATFPNIAGAVTPTHTELNYVDGVTSAIQTQIDAKAPIASPTFTGTVTIPSGAVIAGYAPTASPTFTGTINATGATLNAATQSLGDSSTKVATTAFVASTAFSSTLPAQTGNNGKYLTTDGSSASWQEVLPSQTGNSGKVLSTNGTSTSWIDKASIPLGALVAFDGEQSGNTVVDGNYEYLKTGVITDASTYPNAMSSAYYTYTATNTNAGTALNGLPGAFASNGTIAVAFISSNIKYSTNGVDWTNAIVANIDAGGCVDWSGSVFLAISESGRCWTSPDGVTWTQKTTLPTGTQWRALGYGNSTWVAAHHGTTQVAYSTNDGTSWTSATNSRSPSWAGGTGHRIPYGAGVFVIADASNTSSSGISTSTTGATWTTRSGAVFDTYAKNCVFGNGYFVYAGYDSGANSPIYTSTDGITWTGRTGNYSNNGYVWFANGAFAITKDTNDGTWGPATANNPTTAWSSLSGSAISTGGGYPIITALNLGGAYVGVRGAALASTSLDGQRFLDRSTPSLRPIYAAGYWWSGAGQALSKSPDGITWCRGVFATMSSTIVGKLAHTGTHFVVHPGTTGAVTRSTDGQTWSSSGTPTDLPTGELIAANGILYSMKSTASTTVSYSTDNGATWSQITGLTSATYKGVVYAGGVYLMWSDTSDAHYRSTNGTTWTVIPAGQLLASIGYGIKHDGTYFYAPYASGTVLKRSTDGITWTDCSTSLYRSSTFSFLSGGNGTTVFVANNTNGGTLGAIGSTGTKWRLISGLATAEYVSNGTSTYVSASSGVLTKVTDKVCNDVNLKTYNATAGYQTDFYKRVK